MAVETAYRVTEWGLKPGDRILRTALHTKYGGRPQGGIGPSRVSPNVLIFTDPAAGEPHGYYDGWREDGAFHYTGEGQRGDQRMVSGNATILRHEQEGRALRVFQSARGEVEYIDEFLLDASQPSYEMDAPETDGGPIRKVIVFRLRPVNIAPEPPESPLAKIQGPTIEAVPVEEQYTERSFVDPGREPYEAERREAKLVRALRDHLSSAGHDVVRFKILPDGEVKPLYADLFDETAGVLLEAKGSVTREAFRMAIGQLADYSRFLPPDSIRAILVPEEPRPDLLSLAETVGVTVVWPSGGSYEGRPGVPW